MIDDHPAHGRYTLRDLVDEDEYWMWPAGNDALRPYVDPIFGWDEKVSRHFFDLNWRNRRVVLVDGENAGWLELRRDGEKWLYLAEIGLLPEFRNQGLGTRIIEDVFAYADANGLVVELQVLKTNPAKRLYERLGFETSHYKMHRKAKARAEG